MKLLAVEKNEPLQHNNSAKETLECDTEEEIIEESHEEIKKQKLSVCFSSAGVLFRRKFRKNQLMTQQNIYFR